MKKVVVFVLLVVSATLIGCNAGPYKGGDGLSSCYELLKEKGPSYYNEVLGMQPDTIRMIERCSHDYYTSIN